MDKDAKISGWKQYPLQPTIQINKPLNDNENIATQFKPLDSGVKFKGKIRFHNLKKVEIGALFSALTFHGRENTHFHNIGMAKPLGYGQIEVKITNIKNLKYSKKDYLEEFEGIMNEWEDKEYDTWINSVQIKSLFAYHDNSEAKNLTYQKLENPEPIYFKRNGQAEKNDFIGAKSNREFLKSYINDISQTQAGEKQPKKRENKGLRIVKKKNKEI